MSNSFNQQLSHPELMSKEAIIEVLKTRCIEMPETKLLNKDELLDIYRRIALPLPQRSSVDGKHLNKKMALLRAQKCIPIASFEDNKELDKLIQCTNGYVNNFNSTEKRLKSVEDSIHSSKKIRLVNTATSQKTVESQNKRKNCSNIEVSPSKQKYQKITWP